MKVLRPLVMLCFFAGVLSTALAGTGTRRAAPRPALEVNVGQVRTDNGLPADHVRAFSRQGNVTSYLHPTGAHLVTRTFDFERREEPTAPYTETAYRCDMRFLGGNPMARTIHGATAGGPSRYYLPGLNGVAAEQLTSMTFVDVWDGIDVRWTSGMQGLKYEFVVRPGADPSAIAIAFDGASSTRTTADGGFELATPMGVMNEAAPVSWRSADHDGRSNIGPADVRFMLSGNVLRFDVRSHDPSKTLVIDPAQIWTTYYSGNADIAEEVRLAKDKFMNVIITGASPATNLPTTVGVIQRNKKNGNGNWDGFIAKFDIDGKHLWSTYYGSSKQDAFRDVACDSLGNVWAVGFVGDVDAPNLIVDGKDATGKDTVKKFDILVVKLNPKGAWIDAFTMSGRENDIANAIDITGSNVTIVGVTRSPEIYGLRGTPYAKASAGTPPLPDNNDDAFIARFIPVPNNPDRSKLSWLTFFGGTAYDDALAVRCNSAGDIFVCGKTVSTNIPSTLGTFGGGSFFDGWIARFPSAGGARTWCTYLGGSLDDQALDIAVDNQGTPTVVGTTISTNFPVTPGLDGFIAGRAGFIAQLNAGTGARTWSTLVAANGVIGSMQLKGVAIDQSRRIWVTGFRELVTGWTTTTDAFQKTVTDETRTYDGIMARYSPTGQRQYASYLSAPSDPGIPAGLPPAGSDLGRDECFDVMCEGDAYMIFANITTSNNFPTKNAYQDSTNLLSTGLARNAVIAFFSDCPDSTISITGPSNICNGQPIQLAAPIGFAKYQWSTGETTRTITVADSGSYILTAITDKGCRYRDTLKVQYFVSASISAGKDITICKDTLTELSVTITGGTPPFKYKWNRIESGQEYIQGDTTATPKVFPATTSNYEIATTDANGCISRDTILVAVLDPKPTFGSGNVEFGLIDACSSFGEAGFILRNPMPYPITVTTITSATGTISDATPLGAGGLTIPANGSADLMARYTPTAPGVVTGTIILRGMPCGWTATIPFRADKARLGASVAPGTVSFGVASACETIDVIDTVEIRNGGTDPLVVQPGIVGAPYSVVAPTAETTVDPGKTLDVIIRYAPSAAGTYNDQLKLPYTAGLCDDTLRVNLSGVASKTDVRALSTTIAMPDLSGCETEMDTTITLTNTGDAPISLTWTAPADAVITTTQPLTVAPGKDAVIPVTIRPSAIGPYSVPVEFTATPCELKLTVTLTGSKQGVSFDTPPTIALGEVNSCAPGGASASGSITYNGTSGTGSVTDVVTGPGITTTLAKNATLAAGTPLSFNVTWTPTQDGALVDSIVVILQPCDTRRVIRVTGVRTTPAIAPAQPAVDLGTLPVGGTTGTITFRNSGTDTLSAIVGSDTPGIIVTGTRPAALTSILPGTTIEVDYRIPCDAGTGISGTIAAVANPCALTAATTITAVCSKPPAVGTAIVALDTQRVSVGDRVTMPIRIVGSSNLNSSDARSWRALVSYDPYILVATGSTRDCYTEGMMGRCTTEVTGVRGADTVGTVGQLTFTAVLGYTSFSAVQIESFDWTSQTPVTTTVRHGRVEIDNICNDRYLVYKRGTTVNVRPQPADDVVEISMQTSAPTSDVVLYDLIGNVVDRMTIALDRDGAGTIDVRHLEAGTYLLTARVGDIVRSNMIVIAR
ncbi:MAG: T9SS type A sorting domain-containing protein [Candidatus Kapabacteria bacterium]|nr:T9SS type A sorting domain-containing protein [Candidatus Kapabacteria bacterium]